MRSRALRMTTFAAAAFTGLLGAHALDYSLLARDPIVRSRLLISSGHAWVSRAPEFAFVSLGIAVLAAFALGFRHAGSRRGSTFLRTAVLLSLVQGGAFVALEAGERLASGARADRIVLVTAIGVALQIATAAIAALAIALLQRAGAIVARAFSRAPRMRRAIVGATWFGGSSRALSRFGGSPTLGRAPPYLLG